MKSLHCLNVKYMFKCVLFNLNLILYKKSQNFKMFSIKSRGQVWDSINKNISRHPVYRTICIHTFVFKCRSLRQYDGNKGYFMRPPFTALSTRTWSPRLVFRTAKVYRYRCTALGTGTFAKNWWCGEPNHIVQSISLLWHWGLFCSF